MSAAERFARLPTAAKLLLILTAVLLPIGIAMALIGEIGMRSANRAIAGQAFDHARITARAVESLIARNALALRVTANAALASGPAGACERMRNALAIAPGVAQQFRAGGARRRAFVHHWRDRRHGHARASRAGRHHRPDLAAWRCCRRPHGRHRRNGDGRHPARRNPRCRAPFGHVAIRSCGCKTGSGASTSSSRCPAPGTCRSRDWPIAGDGFVARIGIPERPIAADRPAAPGAAAADVDRRGPDRLADRQPLADPPAAHARSRDHRLSARRDRSASCPATSGRRWRSRRCAMPSFARSIGSTCPNSSRATRSKGSAGWCARSTTG